MKKLILLPALLSMFIFSCKKDKIEPINDQPDNIPSDTVDIMIQKSSNASTALGAIVVECDCEILSKNSLAIKAIMKKGDVLKSEFNSTPNPYVPSWMGPITYKVFNYSKSKEIPVYTEQRTNKKFEYTHE